jgi:hypothetical protein
MASLQNDRSRPSAARKLSGFDCLADRDSYVVGRIVQCRHGRLGIEKEIASLQDGKIFGMIAILATGLS